MGRPAGITSARYDGRRSATIKTVDLSGEPAGEYHFSAGDLADWTERDTFDAEIVLTVASSTEDTIADDHWAIKGDADAPDDTYILFQAAARAWFFEHQGASIQCNSQVGQAWDAGDTLRLRMSHDPRTRALIARIQVNSCRTLDALDGSVATVTAPVDLYFASNAGAAPEWTDAQIEELLVYSAHASQQEQPRGVILGDSTSASMLSPVVTAIHPCTGSFFAMPTGTVCLSIANAGDEWADQVTDWSAWAGRTSALAWIYMECGINDAIGGATGAQILASAQAAVNTVAADNPGVPIFVGLAQPCKDGLTESAWDELGGHPTDSYNARLLSGELTGVTRIVTGHYSALSDPDNDGALRTEYAGDGVHCNTLGQRAKAAAIVADIAGAGFSFP